MKVIVLIIAILIIAAFFGLFFIKRGVHLPARLSVNAPTNPIAALPIPSSNILGAQQNLTTIENPTKNPLLPPSNLNSTINNLVTTVIGTPANNAVQVTNLPAGTIPDPKATTIAIDFQGDHNLQLNLSKNTQYYLQFKNFPLGFCLYINTSAYQINNNQPAQLTFSDAGTYSLHFDFCNQSSKNLGQFIVE